MTENQNNFDQPVPPPYRPEPDIPPLKPNTWMWQSILVTLCCFTFFGIVALVNSFQVSSAYYAGDYERSLRASKRAKMWSVSGFIIGIIYAIVMSYMMIKGNYFDEISGILNDGAYSIYNF